MQARETEAFEEFVREYGPFVYKAARVILRGSQHTDVDVEDVVQTVLIRIIERPETLPSSTPSSIVGWLVSLTRRVAIDFVRSGRKGTRSTVSTSVKKSATDEKQAPLIAPPKELVLEIAIPEGVPDAEVIAAIKRVSLNANDLHRALGGKGLKIKRLDIEAQVAAEVPLG